MSLNREAVRLATLSRANKRANEQTLNVSAQEAQEGTRYGGMDKRSTFVKKMSPLNPAYKKKKAKAKARPKPKTSRKKAPTTASKIVDVAEDDLGEDLEMMAMAEPAPSTARPARTKPAIPPPPPKGGSGKDKKPRKPTYYDREALRTRTKPKPKPKTRKKKITPAQKYARLMSDAEREEKLKKMVLAKRGLKEHPATTARREAEMRSLERDIADASASASASARKGDISTLSVPKLKREIEKLERREAELEAKEERDGLSKREGEELRRTKMFLTTHRTMARAKGRGYKGGAKARKNAEKMGEMYGKEVVAMDEDVGELVGSGFFEDFGRGFMKGLRAVSGVAKAVLPIVAPGVGSLASEGLSAIGLGKCDYEGGAGLPDELAYTEARAMDRTRSGGGVRQGEEMKGRHSRKGGARKPRKQSAKMKARNDLVRKLMRENGMSLPQASKYIKENGLM